MPQNETTANSVGFTGTQKGMTRAQAAVLSDLLSGRAAWLHHGDCIGADAQAHDIAKARGYLLACHPPANPSKRAYCKGFDRFYPEKDYIPRNHDIVDATDELIATPAQFQEELRSGTWATVRYARKQRKRVTIIHRDGTLEYQPMSNETTIDVPYDQTRIWIRGKAIWSTRYDGRPEREFLDSLCPDDRKCVEAWLWIRM